MDNIYGHTYLSFILRMSKKGIADTCKGFFEDQRHLQSHFADLTGSSPLNQNVQDHLAKFISKITLFIS